MAGTMAQRWTWVALGAVVACVLAMILPSTLHTSLLSVNSSVETLRFNVTEESAFCKSFAQAVSAPVYMHQHHAYHGFTDTFWSINAAEKRPDCVVQPRNTQEVAAIVRHLKTAYERDPTVLFAVRGGGHSPEAGFSSIDDGVVVDMSLINEVTVSDDQTSTVIGMGARWGDVYAKLDSMGLAIVGGRNSNVGVGGLVLGGGISFFSPRFGMVCDNVDKYEIVIANGSIIEATATDHPDLWRALKGGTGNFGIVTRVTTKTFLSGDLWAGYAFWPNFQVNKVLKAFHDFNKPEMFDAYAGGPILALAYVQNVGMRLVACSLSYTRPQAWPPVFNGFKKIWRYWSTAKLQSLYDTTLELHGQAPPGRRQFQATTTIKNDLDTFHAFEQIYTEKLEQVRSMTGGIWGLVFQPLSAAVTRKGSPNVLGLETRHANDTLIIVLVSLSWEKVEHDELAHRIAREIIAEGEVYAKSHSTWDPFLYLNYAASGQDVYAGYGEANKEFLAVTSRKYDPEGFFQHSRQGGFKVPM